MKDSKNQHKNMLMIEDIYQHLQDCTQTLNVLPPQVLKLRRVQHLRHCIWTELSQANDMLCLMRLQPTAAAAGTPRELAREFIQQNELSEREQYAGSADYLPLCQNELCVPLRSAEIGVNVVRLYAGAGIARDSDLEQEW